MQTPTTRYMIRCYSTYVVPDMTTNGEPCFLAYHPELEGCMSHGATSDEALSNLEEVTELYIAALAEEGIPIPEPQGVAVAWDFGTGSISESEGEALLTITPPEFAPVP